MQIHYEFICKHFNVTQKFKIIKLKLIRMNVWSIYVFLLTFKVPYFKRDYQEPSVYCFL